MGSKFFWKPKSKIHKSYLRNPYLHRFWKFQTGSFKNVGGVGILVIATWTKWHFEIWRFLWFLEDKMVNLGQIDFELGLPLNINVNDGQNNFEVHTSKIWPK